MRVGTSVLSIVATFTLVMYLMLFLDTYQTAKREFDTDRLSIALDYATEAAFLEATMQGNISTDYDNLYKVVLNPCDTLDVVETLICLNYGMSVGEENKKLVENSIGAALIACNDGYYITAYDGVDLSDNGKEYPIKWSLKRPYSLTVYNDNDVNLPLKDREASGIKGVYSTHLDDRGGILLKSNGTLVYYNNYKSNADLAGYPINDSLVRESISNSINDALNYTLNMREADRGGKTYNLYIPTEDTTSLNSIKYPSFLLIMHGGDWCNNVKLDQPTLGGYKIIRSTKVIGYTRDVDGESRKLYCYENQLTPEQKEAYTIEYFRTVDEAAEAGYTPDYGYIYNKIDVEMGTENIPHS